jgi:hypothetical protein
MIFVNPHPASRLGTFNFATKAGVRANGASAPGVEAAPTWQPPGRSMDANMGQQKTG